MARWTNSNTETSHFVEINEEISKATTNGFIIKVEITDGRSFTGVYAGHSTGNNAGTGVYPPTSFYGDIKLRTIEGNTLVIDILDIKKVLNFTSPAVLCQFEDAGVITVVSNAEEGED